MASLRAVIEQERKSTIDEPSSASPCSAPSFYLFQDVGGTARPGL
jgi:hypothetical protein